jgi:hypothetical protein
MYKNFFDLLFFILFIMKLKLNDYITIKPENL